MQNKGLVKFIAIVFALVCIYQLSFTWVTNHYEKKAKEFANGDLTKEARYLDSIGSQEVYLGNTFREVRDKQLQKGLDLEGGINVTLQISVKDILKSLSNNSNNAIFNQALAETEKNRQGNQTFLDAFYTTFDKLSQGKVKLASSDLFANRNLQEVTTSMSDAEVKKILDAKVKESIESAYRVLGERIDKFGVVSPTIQMIGESGRILVELPGAKDIDRIKALLQSTAQLEFWETYKAEEVQNFLLTANEALRSSSQTTTEETKKDTLSTEKTDVEKLLTGTSKEKETKKTENNDLGPLLSLIQAPGMQGSPVLGYFKTADTAQVNSYLKRPEIRNLLSGEQRHLRFAWGKTKKDSDITELYALKGNAQQTPPLSGGVITNARDEFDQMGRPSVSMQMNTEGAKIWEELTGKAYSQQSNIAIVLDNVVYSAPGVSTGPISGGNSSITGDFTVSETKDLANILKAGKLPASADIVSSEIVGPSLGAQAIQNGIVSAIVGFVLVGVWMVFYYGRAGWYANIALLVNLLFMFGILASFGAVLTLPGIAGIVLTMGTAVDANILMYERAKEELRQGNNLLDAVNISYSWNGSMRAIVDANVTNILTGIILFIFGTGAIKGFATTLLIGIFTSLFTSIFIAQIFISRDINKNKVLTFATSITKNWFTNFNYDFLKRKKIAYIFSGIVMLVSIGSLFTNGLDQGVEFVGGRTFQVRFDKAVDQTQIAENLTKEFGVNVEVKQFGSKEQMRIVTKYKIEDESSTVDQEVNKKLYEGLKTFYSKPITYEQFIHPEGESDMIGVVQASKVNPTVSNDLKADSIWAVVGSMVVVFIYLLVSFRKWQYSLGAVISVLHDVVFVLGIYSLFYKVMPFQMELNQHFIAAILTVVGYSLNDSVIVFDRVREYVTGKSIKGDFNHIVNQSVNTTLSRTINTTFTLILVLFIMFIFGGESIRGFIFAMLVGMIVGTYSSLFLGTPILVDTMPKKDKEEIVRRQNEASESSENTELV